MRNPERIERIETDLGVVFVKYVTEVTEEWGANIPGGHRIEVRDQITGIEDDNGWIIQIGSDLWTEAEFLFYGKRHNLHHLAPKRNHL